MVQVSVALSSRTDPLYVIYQGGDPRGVIHQGGHTHYRILPDPQMDSSHSSALEGTLSEGHWSFEPVTKDLAEARHDLRLAGQEAHDLGYPQPSPIAVANATRLLTTMYWMAPRRFDVYPTPDGEIAIDTSPATGKSLIVLCDSDGEVLCLLYVDGRQERRRYPSAGELRPAVMRSYLRRLGDPSV